MRTRYNPGQKMGNRRISRNVRSGSGVQPETVEHVLISPPGQSEPERAFLSDAFGPMYLPKISIP